MATQNPLISIICAVRNDKRFIRETLETVVSQSYPNLELIIMDGASTDGTQDIVKEYAAKHKNIVFRSEPDQGQWDALDKALAISKGEYLSILCGQDGYLNKDWFKRCIQTFEEHPEVSLVWGIPFNMSEDGKLVGPAYAYASFLRDKQFGSRIKPMSTIAARIDWRRPAVGKRLRRLLGKLTWARIAAVLRGFGKKSIPQGEAWFFYWLRTNLPFPEGNMCVRKEVFVRNTVRFPEEKFTNRALLDFCFSFNANGYLAYGLPVAASFGRLHAGGQPLLAYEDAVIASYHGRVADLREKMKEQKTFKFVNAAGQVFSERALNS